MVDEYVRAMFMLVAIAVICLTVLAVSYWIIMREDSTVLTTVSSTLGGLIGYTIRKLIEMKKVKAR